MEDMRLCELTDANFRTVGTCHDMLHPEWEKIGDGKAVDFYRDILSLRLGKDASASFSLCHALSREPLVDAVEYHTSTEEAILPLDADIVMVLAPATPGGSVPLEKMKAYRIPRGTMIILKAGVWHSGPHVMGSAAVHILVALPERTYANDCIVRELGGAERMRITGL
jgi:ureidoglycolate lyase